MKEARHTETIYYVISFTWQSRKGKITVIKSKSVVARGWRRGQGLTANRNERSFWGDRNAPFTSWLGQWFRVYRCVLSRFSHVWPFVILWTVVHQAPLSMGFSRQEHCSGLLCPALGDLPSPGIEPTSLMSPAQSGGFLTTSVTWEIQGSSYKILCTYLNSLTYTLKIGFIVLNYISKTKQKKIHWNQYLDSSIVKTIY